MAIIIGKYSTQLSHRINYRLNYSQRSDVCSVILIKSNHWIMHSFIETALIRKYKSQSVGSSEPISNPNHLNTDIFHRIDDHMSDEDGSLVEPVAVAVSSCRRANVTVGDTVLICGSGPIGLVNILVAREYGAKTIYITGGHSCDVPSRITRLTMLSICRFKSRATETSKRVGSRQNYSYRSEAFR